MNYRPLNNITPSPQYNTGGISNIYLLDKRDFISYRFQDDKLYDECYVEKIKTSATFVELSTVDESTFTETLDNGIYKQALTTFIPALRSNILSNILIAKSNKYIVAFRTPNDKLYTFGSDGGASLTFSQTTGQTSETAGLSITLSKNSIYPLFEVATEHFNAIDTLATENKNLILTEEYLYITLI